MSDIASILMLNGGGSLPRKGDNPVLEALIDGALKKSQEPGFFSREAGQNRRAWLDETVNYFTPPELRGPLGLLNEANPVTSMERASTASQTMLAPETSGWGRVAAGGDMLSNMAGVVAPAMVASKAGLPAVNAIEEGLLGFAPGMPAAAGNFLADEFGGMKLYHGSPHDFDKFSMDKIGTGEGAQAYGHGLYFAENESVARGYRDALAGNNYDTGYRNVDAALNGGAYQGDWARFAADHPDIAKEIEAAGRNVPVGSSGRMYEVEVNANPEDFLDWDAPLSAQPQAVQRLAMDGDISGAVGPTKGKMKAWREGRDVGAVPTGQDLNRALSAYGENGAAATDAFRQAGIPGIRYLDAGSRGADGAGGSRNYVVFDESLINIVKKYGVAGAATMLGVSQAEVAQAMEGQQ